jgi:hypothetical protein
MLGFDRGFHGTGNGAVCVSTAGGLCVRTTRLAMPYEPVSVHASGAIPWPEERELKPLMRHYRPLLLDQKLALRRVETPRVWGAPYPHEWRRCPP